MRADAFDFELPPELIALWPARPRDSARMLVVDSNGSLMDSRVADLPKFLQAGDAIVVNDTRVIAARLEGVRVRNDVVASVEATLVKRVDSCRWRALVRPAKRLKVGERIRFGETSESMACLLASLDAEVEEKRDGGEVLLRFHFTDAALDEAIERLVARGVAVHRVTLHLGPGTFAPVKVEDVEDHKMHSEEGCIDPTTADALNGAWQRGGRVVAVGTTSARILETAANERGFIQAFAGETSLFIAPGYRFRAR